MVDVDDTRSKSDGGNVSLPRSAQAEDKTQCTGRQVRLVRVRDDGGIEQGCRFQGVFANEIGADQQLSLFRNFLIGQQEVADLFESFQKGFVDLLERFEQVRDLLLTDERI